MQTLLRSFQTILTPEATRSSRYNRVLSLRPDSVTQLRPVSTSVNFLIFQTKLSPESFKIFVNLYKLGYCAAMIYFDFFQIVGPVALRNFLAMFENVALQIAEVWCYTTTRSGPGEKSSTQSSSERKTRSVCMRPY